MVHLSHVLEDIPYYLISDASARHHKTAILDIRYNCQAELTAKIAMKSQVFTSKKIDIDKLVERFGWQTWIEKLSIEGEQIEATPQASSKSNPFPFH